MGTSLKDLRPMMYELADDIAQIDDVLAGRLRWIADEVPRNKAKHMTRPKRRRMTAQLGHKARELVRLHPDKNLDEIGQMLNLAGGRISEAINGKHWDPILEGGPYEPGQG